MLRYLVLLGFCGLLCAETPEPTSDSIRHPTASLAAEELGAFAENLPEVRVLLEQCLALTR